MLGNNIFAYCGNDAINSRDPRGDYHRSIGVDIRRIAFDAPGLKGTALALLQSQGADFDGDFALYENSEECCGGEMTAQLLAGSVSAFEVNDEGISLGGFDVSLLRCTWDVLCYEIDIGNMLNANVSADIAWSGSVDVNAMVSAWSPSIAVKTDKGTFTYSAHIGSAGVALAADLNGAWGFGVSYGFGFGFSYQP